MTTTSTSHFSSGVSSSTKNIKNNDDNNSNLSTTTERQQMIAPSRSSSSSRSKLTALTSFPSLLNKQYNLNKSTRNFTHHQGNENETITTSTTFANTRSEELNLTEEVHHGLHDTTINITGGAGFNFSMDYLLKHSENQAASTSQMNITLLNRSGESGPVGGRHLFIKQKMFAIDDNKSHIRRPSTETSGECPNNYFCNPYLSKKIYRYTEI